jgi:WD40 repeat protein
MRADAVERPWEMVLEAPGAPPRSLPPDERILDVFEEMDRALLILGEPGSGKTITLLQLAREACASAEQDPTQPIPVVFVLSSWAQTKLGLAAWLTEELNTKYQIPKKIGASWIENNDLLLLLDGLDEVAPGQRAACVDAINAFRRDYGLTAVAVCSRIAEYEALVKRLKLQGAVVLQPLTAPQVDRYFSAAGADLTSLRTVMQSDAALQDLAQSPLMLSVMTLAYQGLPAEALQGGDLESIESRRDHLFATYVDRMFKRRKANRRYPVERSLSWLTWLARTMAQHNQAVFFLEQMQPSWLSTRGQRWRYVLSSRLTGAGAIAFAFLLPAFGLWKAEVFGFWLTVLIGCLSAGFTMGWVDGWRLARGGGIALDTARQQDWRRSTREVLTTGLTAVLGFGLWLTVADRVLGMGLLSVYARFWGLAVVVTIFLGFGLIFGWRGRRSNIGSSIQTVEGLNWSWRRFLTPVLAGVAISGAAFLIASLTREPDATLWDAQGHRIASLHERTLYVAQAGTRIVTGTGVGDALRLWDGMDGRFVASLELDWYWDKLDTSPDGTRLLMGGGSKTALWDTMDGRLIGTIPGSPEGFVQGGTRLVTGSTAKLWNAQNARLIAPLIGKAHDLRPVATRIITVDQGRTVRLWDSQDGAFIARLGDPIVTDSSVFMSPDGMRIATIGKEGPPHLWNAEDGRFIGSLAGWVGSVSLSFNATGTRILAYSQDDKQRLWNGENGQLVAVLDDGPAWLLRFSPDGMRVATVRREGSVRLWNAEYGRPIARLNVAGAPPWLLNYKSDRVENYYPLFDPSGNRIVTLSQDGVVQLWDGRQGRLIRKLEGQLDIGLTLIAFSVSFNPNGTRLVTVSQDGIARLWDGKNGDLLAAIEKVEQRANSIAITPDGTKLLTVFSPDGTKLVTVFEGVPVDTRPFSIFGSALGLLIGLLIGLRSNVRETKTSPNQGIWLSLRNSLVIGLSACLVFALLSAVILVAFKQPLAKNLPIVLGLSGFFAVLAALMYGGFDVLQHFILRLILGARKQIPWNYARFLDQGAERILLRKVGGGYIFIHRLLLEHFAARAPARE